MEARKPSGIFSPVATIFDDNEELDLAGFRSNMSSYATSALDGIVILGSNGEFPLLDVDEKLRLIEAGVEAIGGRKIVMAGTGAESTRATIALTKQAAELGIDYALVVTPHYFTPRYDRQAYLAHYRAVAEASPVPVLIYVMTTYTGVDLASSLIAELASHPNVVGVKDSGGSAPKLAEMVARCGPDFAVLAGSASFLYPALCLGAAGGVLALANIAPAACKDVQRLYEAGRHDAARQLQFRLLAPNAAVTSRHGIAGLKIGMELVGLKGGRPRSPLQVLTAAEAEDVRRTLREAELAPPL